MENFKNKLELLLDHYNLTASSFAEKIGVQRSSMSHLLSGRNKPSLDFVLKITEHFPEVDLYWFLKDEGEFPKVESSPLAEPKAIKIQDNLFEQAIIEEEKIEPPKSNPISEEINLPNPPIEEPKTSVAQLESTIPHTPTFDQKNIQEESKPFEQQNESSDKLFQQTNLGAEKFNDKPQINYSETNQPILPKESMPLAMLKSKKIEMVLVLQTDGTFKEYTKS